MTKRTDSLSVVLPVHNDAESLPARVAELLEILPDLTAHFEILIVDNGSTDFTDEVAYELACHFPQLRLLRQPRRQSRGRLLDLGLQNTRGDLVIVCEEKSPILASRLRRLWELRKDNELVTALGEENAGRPLVERLRDWASQLKLETAESPPAGMHIVRREPVSSLPPNPLHSQPWRSLDTTAYPVG